MNESEFERLVESVVEGVATREETERFEDLLLASAARRKQFRQATLLHQRLKMELGAGREISGPAVNIVPVREILRRQNRRGWLATVAASAAVILAGVFVMRLVLSRETPPTLAVTAAPNTAYELMDDGTSGATTDRELALEPGSRLTLRQGSLHLNFASGVEGVVMGPAELILRGPLDLAMPRGTARFRVGRKGTGFRVVTPLAEVVDLGTDFGVVSDGTRPPQVHVFGGRVRASAQKGLQEQREIAAGHAFEISGIGKFHPLPPDPDLFLTELPTDLPYLHFSFDSQSHGKLEVSGTHPAVAGTMADLDPRGGSLAPGRVGQALALPGRATPVRTNWNGITHDSPRTIAMWIKPAPSESPRRMRSMVMWGTRSSAYPSMCELLLYSKDPGAGAHLRLSFGDVYYTGRTNIADGQWHHVAAVYRGNQVQPGEKIVTLYVDGRAEEIDSDATREAEERSLPSTLTGTGFAEPMRIGSAATGGHDHGFAGLIDELHIFEAALDPERVRELANP